MNCGCQAIQGKLGTYRYPVNVRTEKTTSKEQSLCWSALD